MKTTVVSSETCLMFSPSPRRLSLAARPLTDTRVSPARPAPTVSGTTAGGAPPAGTCHSSEGGDCAGRAVSSGSVSSQPKANVPPADYYLCLFVISK